MKAITLLKGAGLTRADIAKAVGLESDKTVWHWERGSRRPNSENFAKLARLAEGKGIRLIPEDFIVEKPTKAA